jgi:hypothetical protein
MTDRKDFKPPHFDYSMITTTHRRRFEHTLNKSIARLNPVNKSPNSLAKKKDAKQMTKAVDQSRRSARDFKKMLLAPQSSRVSFDFKESDIKNRLIAQANRNEDACFVHNWKRYHHASCKGNCTLNPLDLGIIFTRRLQDSDIHVAVYSLLLEIRRKEQCDPIKLIGLLCFGNTNPNFIDASVIRRMILLKDQNLRSYTSGLSDWSETEPDEWGNIAPQAFNVGVDADTREMVNEILGSIAGLSNDVSALHHAVPEMTRFNDNFEDLNVLISRITSMDLKSEMQDMVKMISKEAEERIKDAKSNVFGFLNNTTGYAAMIAVIFYYCCSPSRERAILVILVGLGCYCFTTIFQDFGKYLLEFIQIDRLFASSEEIVVENIVPQVDMDQIDSFSSMVTTLVNGYFLTKHSTSLPKDLLTGLNNFSRTKSSIGELLTLVISTFEKGYNYIATKFRGVTGVRFLESNNEQVRKFLDDVHDIFDKVDEKTFVANDENYKLVSHYIQVGRNLSEVIGRERREFPIAALLRKDCSTLEKIRTMMSTLNYKIAGTRPEAVCVLFGGGPGCGKSVTVDIMAKELTYMFMPDQQKPNFFNETGDHIFNRQYENVYWEGYTPKHFVCIMDDVGQFKDVAGSPDNEWANIIRAANGFEYTLHAADINNKGKLIFNSKFLLLTTNLKEVNPVSITTKAAIDRRFHLRVICFPKDKYCINPRANYWNRRVDTSKLETRKVMVDGVEKITSVLGPSMQSFIMCDDCGTGYGSEFSYEQLVAIAVKMHEDRVLWKKCSDEITMEYCKRHDSLLEKCVEMPAAVGQVNAAALSAALDTHVENEVTEFKRDLRLFNADFQVGDRFYAECMLLKEDIGTLETFINRLYVRKFDRDGVSIIHKLYCLYQSGFPLMTFLTDDVNQINREVEKYLDDIVHPMVVPPMRIKASRWYLRIKAYIIEFLEDIGATSAYRGLKNWLVNSPALQRFGTLIMMGLQAALIQTTAIVGTISIIQLITKLVTWWYGAKEKPQKKSGDNQVVSNFKPQSFEHGAKMYKKPKPSGKKNPVIQSQMCHVKDKSGFELIAKFAKRNMYQISSRVGDEYKAWGRMVMLKGNIALMPFHYITEFRDGMKEVDGDLELYINKSNSINSFAYAVKASEFLAGMREGVLKKVDMILVQLPKSVPAHIDGFDLFMTEDDLSRIQMYRDMMFVTLDVNGDLHYQDTFVESLVRNVHVVDTEHPYRVDRSLRYYAMCQAGDCGSILYIPDNTRAKRKIVGIHVAGDENLTIGFGAVITQEMLTADLILFQDVYVLEDCEEIEVEMGTINPHPQFLRVGKLKGPTRCLKSDIIKSRMAFCEELPRVTKPAKLRDFEIDGETISPLKNALNKYCRPPVHFDEEELEIVANHFFADLVKNSKNRVVKRILTVEEAIYGIDGEDDFGSINSSSSPGFPMNVSGVRNIKKILFKTERGSPEWKLVMEEIESDIAFLIQKMELGIRPMFIACDNLKDERREKEKVLLGKTRLFSGFPFYELILDRMFFGSFHIWYNKNRISNGSSVGINPYSEEWDIMVREASLRCPDLNLTLSGDFSAYDGSEKPQIHMWILWIINHWYEDAATQKRRILWEGIHNSHHIVDGVIYTWCSSLGSGHYGTTTVNTMYGHFAARLVWYRIGQDLTVFVTYVFLVQNGDDNLWSIDPQFCHIITYEVLEREYLKMGLVYTNELKSIMSTDHREISACEFLKRSFRYDTVKMRYLAPLRLEVVLEMSCWTKKKVIRDIITADNVETAIRELSLHPKEVFDHWRKVLVDCYSANYNGPALSTLCYLNYKLVQNFVLASEMVYMR